MFQFWIHFKWDEYEISVKPLNDVARRFLTYYMTSAYLVITGDDMSWQCSEIMMKSTKQEISAKYPYNSEFIEKYVSYVDISVTVPWEFQSLYTKCAREFSWYPTMNSRGYWWLSYVLMTAIADVRRSQSMSYDFYC